MDVEKHCLAQTMARRFLDVPTSQWLMQPRAFRSWLCWRRVC